MPRRAKPHCVRKKSETGTAIALESPLGDLIGAGLLAVTIRNRRRRRCLSEPARLTAQGMSSVAKPISRETLYVIFICVVAFLATNATRLNHFSTFFNFFHKNHKKTKHIYSYYFFSWKGTLSDAGDGDGGGGEQLKTITINP